MRILIVTPSYPPEVGGPSQYAKGLEEAFRKEGHEVRIARYTYERKLPSWLRQFAFFVKVFYLLFESDCALILDMFGLCIPTIVAGTILRKKTAVRVGGDFLWEWYVERTGNLITLKHFYEKMPALSLKERIVFFGTKFFLRRASVLAFTTEWQKSIWAKAYGFDVSKTAIVENYFRRLEGEAYSQKNFVWAVRPLKLKNGRTLYRAFTEAKKTHPEIVLDDGKYPYEETLRRIKSCYAVILPSISDVSPNLILDAIAYGKPFIVTKESGYSEKFKDIGLIVDPFSESDITEKIIALLEEAQYERYKQKVEAYSFAHSYADIASDYLKLLHRV